MKWAQVWAQIVDFVFDLTVILVADLIFAFPIMWAWNTVMPFITKLPELGYWQIFSLMFLAMIAKNMIKGK